MSCYLNGKNLDSLLVTGPHYPYEWVFHTAAQIASAKPSPAEAFVFIHEADFTVPFGGGWLYLPIRWTWTSFPANHENGHNLSFADGHVEHSRWKDPNTLKAFKNYVDGESAQNNRDLAGLLQATPGWWKAVAMSPGSRPDQGVFTVFP